MAAVKEVGSSFPWRKTSMSSETASGENPDAEFYTIRDEHVSAPPTRPVKVLLVGYNGANNTGSEARLLAIIKEVRSVLGEDARITIPSLNETNLRRYIQESATLKIAPIPTIYVSAIRRLVKESDLVALVEGSCYMDTWTSALLWAFLWATRCAHAEGKPCVSYAVDAGSLSRLNRWLVKREASKADLIVMRNRASSDLLRSLGVTAPTEVTADTAFEFDTDPADAGILSRLWPGSDAGVVGMAPVDFYQWPVVIRPWGRAEDCYDWPYYFSRSKKRSKATEALARGLAAEADRIIERHGKRVALIGMEGLDAPICNSILAHMAHHEDARVFTSLNYNASQMTSILRSLDLLVTSRYHAAVLSMAAGVPLVAVAHDRRLRYLFEEAELTGFFVENTDPELLGKISANVDRLLADPDAARNSIHESYLEQKARAARNKDLLRDFALNHGLRVVQ